MIKEWRFQNFKSVKEPQKISLGPLTILAGANSSGKSSLLQSIMLLTQTLNSKVSQKQIILNGEELRLGTFEDVLSEGSTKREIHIGFSLDLSVDEKLVNSRIWRGEFSPLLSLSKAEYPKKGMIDVDLCLGPGTQTDRDSRSKRSSLQAELLSGLYQIQLESKSKQIISENAIGINKQEIKVTKLSSEEISSLISTLDYEEGSIDNRPDASSLSYSVKFSGLDKDWQFQYRSSRYLIEKLDIIGIRLEHFLPNELINRYKTLPRRIHFLLSRAGMTDNLPNLLQNWMNSNDNICLLLAETLNEERLKQNLSDRDFSSALRSGRFGMLRQSSSSLNFKNIYKAALKKFTDNELERKSTENIPLPDVLDFVNRAISYLFNSIKYLGPLRDEPRPIYDIYGAGDPSRIGKRGENTAYILDIFADKYVDYIDPEIFGSPPIKLPLKEAVGRWLSFFDMAIKVDTKEEGKLGHRLYICPENVSRELDLTNVGVGVSQVLPIIVMALVAESGSVLLFEQPELHLHPRVQSLLGDFFLSIIRLGKQCVVETHSEYLINRLRLRVAESSWTSDLKEKIGIYFVERIEGNTQFRQVRINDYGAIPDWPFGFFDQGPEESDRIMLAARNKKNIKNSQVN